MLVNAGKEGRPRSGGGVGREEFSSNPRGEWSRNMKTWTVTVIYEDTAAREAAVAFCDRLVERFWVQMGFNVSWWSFALLQEPQAAKEAAEAASAAKLIVFATRAEGDLPLAVQAWNTAWLAKRGEQEGTLVGLLEGAPGSTGGTSAFHAYFRQLAHQAGMDYLTQVPESVAQPIPDSPESCCERAEQVTSLLDEILHQRTSPPPVPR
jgi:hypothetical protein